MQAQGLMYSISHREDYFQSIYDGYFKFGSPEQKKFIAAGKE